MFDTGLEETYPVIRKAGHDLEQEVSGRQAVRVKDGDEVAAGQGQTEPEIARFVSNTFFPPCVSDGDTFGMVAGDAFFRQLIGLVCGVVQQQDFQTFPGILQGAGGVNDLMDDSFFVVDRQKHADHRPLCDV